MKPNLKIGSFLMAVVIVLTTFLAVGCTPISLSKQWAYKTADNELAIGVYIYSLDISYQKAKTFAEEQLDDYSESNTDWLDMEITDDDGEKAVAKDWIKKQAERLCISYLALDSEVKKNELEISTDDMAAAEEQAEQYWNLGQYPDYYVMPMKNDLEPYGISFESFAYCTTEYSVKYGNLFESIYQKDGSKAVTDDELVSFINDNYVDYSYMTVDLFDTTTADDGTSENVALTDEDAKKLTDKFDEYAKKINDGTSYSEIVSAYMTENELEESPSVSNIENVEDSESLDDAVKTAIAELEIGKAKTVKVGDGNTAVYYIIYKNDVTKSSKSHIEDEDNRKAAVVDMKTDEFEDYLFDIGSKMDHEANTAQINRYSPDMFFVKPETPETDAEASDDEAEE